MIKDLFTMNTNPNSSALFKRPHIKSVYNGEYSLRSFGPIVWDTMLPAEIKSLSTLEEFKTKVNGWVPNNCPCRLCKVYINGLGFVTLFE